MVLKHGWLEKKKTTKWMFMAGKIIKLHGGFSKTPRLTTGG
jgi:hypothetical protein